MQQADAQQEGRRRSALVACRQCDLVQYEVGLHANADAHCIRCNALLYRGTRSRLDALLALSAGAALLFFVANLFPIASMDLQGVHSSTTLLGTVFALYHQGRPLVAALVMATAILLPALQLAALLYLLFPLRRGHAPRGTAVGFRLLLAARPWSMAEVFLLGVLITLVKLADLATVIPGIALWAFAAAVVLFTAVSASFSTRDFWAWVEASSGAPKRRRMAGTAEG